jgi:multicomponent Na+:H+ antiporter subunit F
MSILFLAVGVLFTIAAGLTMYRIIAGPSILDRMIASDVLLTTLMLVVGAEMVYNGHTRTIPVMLVLASTAVFATVSVARYVSKQDRLARDGGVETSTFTSLDAPHDPSHMDDAIRDAFDAEAHPEGTAHPDGDAMPQAANQGHARAPEENRVPEQTRTPEKTRTTGTERQGDDA